VTTPPSIPPAGAVLDRADLRGRVHATLAAFLTRQGERLAAIDPAALAPVLEAARVLLLGSGKRLRPAFAYWGYRGAGGADADEIVAAVAALELVQASALIHDDLMDRSDTRRGEPAVHRRFAARHAAGGWRGAAAAFGDSAAILLGDLALVWADDMLRGAGLDADAAARAAAPWEAMRTEVLGGQYLDVFVQSTGDSSARAALQIDRYKTAAYTVERPLHLGAAIAGADPDLVACYRRFGADIGVAYQLRDDLLGVFGDPAVTGKPAGDDLREGKRTLLLALAVERAAQRGSPAAVTEIEQAVGDPELDDARLDRIRDLLDELGAVQAVEQRIAALTGSALDALGTGRVAEPAASRLADLAVAATRRRR